MNPKCNMAEVRQNLEDSIQLSLLLDWIESARYTCDTISASEDADPQLKDYLKRWNAKLSNTGWEDFHQTALSILINIQRRLIQSAKDELGGAHA